MNRRQPIYRRLIDCSLAFALLAGGTLPARAQTMLVPKYRNQLGLPA